MSESKFKVGDRVMIKSTKKQGVVISCSPRYINTSFIDFIYRIDTTGYSYRESELELVDHTYTGIELLQAIKDSVFKDGDKFEVLYKGKLMDRAKVIKYGIGSTIRYEDGDIHGNVVGIQVIINKHVTFKPIKKEPINIAKENKMLDVKIPVDILGKREFIDAKVTIKGNKIVVKLPSGVKGVSSCCPEDKFDEQKGVKIASARAIKKQIIRDLDKSIEELVK